MLHPQNFVHFQIYCCIFFNGHVKGKSFLLFFKTSKPFHNFSTLFSPDHSTTTVTLILPPTLFSFLPFHLFRFQPSALRPHHHNHLPPQRTVCEYLVANHRMNLHNPNVWQLSLQLITSVIDTFDYKVVVFCWCFCFCFLFFVFVLVFLLFFVFFCSCCFYTEKKDVYRIARQRHCGKEYSASTCHERCKWKWTSRGSKGAVKM